jgi:hypothetical protein
MLNQPSHALVVPGLAGSFSAAVGVVRQPMQSHESMWRGIQAREDAVWTRQEPIAEDMQATIDDVDVAFPAGLANVVEQPGCDRVVIGAICLEGMIDPQEMTLITTGEDPELHLHGF